MNCKHEQLRCTNNVFFCLKCGAEVPSPYQAGKNPTGAEKPAEALKRAVKRTRKKTDD